MNNRERFMTALAAVGVQKPNFDILLAVFDCMYPEKEAYVTCKMHIYPHVQTRFCEGIQPWKVDATDRAAIFNNVLGAPYESKPMERDSPAVGGCVIPTIKSIVPYVPTTPRNVIADIRETSVDHFVDEPDENGKRGW